MLAWVQYNIQHILTCMAQRNTWRKEYNMAKKIKVNKKELSNSNNSNDYLSNKHLWNERMANKYQFLPIRTPESPACIAYISQWSLACAGRSWSRPSFNCSKRKSNVGLFLVLFQFPWISLNGNRHGPHIMIWYVCSVCSFSLFIHNMTIA